MKTDPATPLRRFKPYPAYKDSGVEWLGEIPAHWTAKHLRWAIMFQRGHDLPTDEREDGQVPVVTSSGISSTHSRAVAKSPGIVTGRYGTIGHFHPIMEDYWPLNTTLYSIDLRGNDPRFLLYMLTHLSPLFLLNAVKSAVPGVDRNDIHPTRTVVPPLDEQRAIATFLDRETARIDALVAKKERLIALLQEKRTALITRAVTKGLGPNVPMKDSGVEWLGEIPAHWEVKRVKFIAQIGNGSTPSREKPEYWGGEYSWLNSSVVNLREVTEPSDFVTDLALAECHLPRIHPPAVLVGITGEGKTRGMATLLRIEATINQHLVFIRPTRSDCDAEYIRYALHAAYQFLRDESGGGGSTKGALTCGQLGNVSIPFPADSEQSAIAVFLDGETARIDTLIAKVRDAIERLKELRTALISAAVTGKIDVGGPSFRRKPESRGRGGWTPAFAGVTEGARRCLRREWCDNGQDRRAGGGSSFRRKPESRGPGGGWTPAFAGVTK